MAPWLILDVWHLVFFYLDEPHVLKFKLTGDKRVANLIERRISGFFIAEQIEKLPWPKSVSEWSELRILVVSNMKASHDVPHQLVAMQYPPTLVALTLDVALAASPFNLRELPYEPNILEALDSVLPSLRLLRCNGLPRGYWIVPSKVTHFHAHEGTFDPSIPLPHSLALLEVNYSDGSLPRLPTSLESVKTSFKKPNLHFDNMDIFHLTSSLTQLKELDVTCFDVNNALTLNQLQQIPRSVTILNLDCFNIPDSIKLADWLPPALISLHLTAYISPLQYESLPRSLTYLTNCLYSRSFGLVMEHQWDLIRGYNFYRFAKLWSKEIGMEVPDNFSENFKKTLCQIPPSFKRIRLAGFPPGLMCEWMEPLSTHFNPGLTSLDMRSTNVKDSQFVHLPLTLTDLNFEGVTLPKVKHLHRLPKLVSIGFYGGTLTTSIAQAIPASVSNLTLSHIALITKGVHYPSSDPNVPVKYSTTAPQTSALFNLPALLKSLTIIPAPDHVYWAESLISIISVLPSAELETLIVDIKTKISSDTPERWLDPSYPLTPSNANSTYSPLLRFSKLRHLFLDCSRRSPVLHLTRHCLLPILPPSLTALHLPTEYWSQPETIFIDSRTTVQSKLPASLCYFNATFGSDLRYYYEWPQHYSVLHSKRMMQDSSSHLYRIDYPDPSAGSFVKSYQSFL